VSPPLEFPIKGSVREWLRQVCPAIKKGAAAGAEGVQVPLECVQGAGQLIYVPEGWWHATVNLVETIGVARQLIPNMVTGDPMRDSPMWWRIAGKDFGVDGVTALEGLTAATDLLPGDADALADLSEAYLTLGEFVLAEKAANLCIKANPSAGRGAEALLIVAVQLLNEVQHLDPHLFNADNKMVQSWIKVGAGALAKLGALALPHPAGPGAWAQQAFRRIQEDVRAAA